MDPRPDEVCIEDIAHALSNLCRFGGHCSRFYSVAEHCVHVSFLVAPSFALAGLLHDASEAYLVDVPRPIKPFLNGYHQAEDRVLQAIFEHVGIHGEIMWEQIKSADNAVLADEARHLMSLPPAKWQLPEEPAGIEIQCWEPKQAKERFQKRYFHLKKNNTGS